MNTYAIPALKEKRAKIAGRIISMKQQLIRCRRELISLDRTITLFDPSYRVGSIKPKRTHKRAQMFKMGQLGRLIIDFLRKAERPVTTAEVVTAIAKTVQEGATSEKLLYPTVRSNLDYMARRGRVIKGGNRDAASWWLP